VCTLISCINEALKKNLATVLAFWRHEGAHSTRAQTWTNWNDDIIQAMVNTVQPSEEPFSTASEGAFDLLQESVTQALDVIPARIGGL
jgi:hypothetical protein